MSSPRPELVVFDLGRVLVRICTGWPHAFEVAGIAIPASVLDPAKLLQFKALSDQHEIGGIEFAAFADRSAALMGLTPAQVLALSNAYTRGHYDGARELLHDLHTAGVATACLSNTNDNHWRLLTSDEYAVHSLKWKFASHLSRKRKPDAAIYAELEEVTGHAGDEILFFDDLPENVHAARARGWQARVVPIVDNPIPFLREELRAAGLLG